MPIDPVSALIQAYGILSSLDRPGGWTRGITIDDEGNVAIRWNARAPAGIRPAAWRRAEHELTRYLVTGEAPSRQVLALLRDEEIAVLDRWIVSHPIIDDGDGGVESSPPEGTRTPKQPRARNVPPGKEPVAPEVSGDEESDLDLDYSSVLGGEQLTPVGAEDFFMPRFTRGLHKSIPGGAAGMAQQAPATLARIGSSLRTGRAPARRSRVARRPRVARSRPRRASAVRRGRPARLVKGSRAAKLHMAKLRRKRRK